MILSIETIFNILVGVVLLFSWVVIFVTLYHLIRFGIGTQPKKLAALFLLGSVLFSISTIIFFMKVDLSAIDSLLSL